MEREANWSDPSLRSIEQRAVNKELETKKVLINFILILLLRLVENFTKLIFIKLEYKTIDLDHDTTIWYIRLILNLLFVYNIGNGIYNVFKPEDEFKDLKLSNEQRLLLGLPVIDQEIININDPIKLEKLEPKISGSNDNISLSPKKPGLHTSTINQPSINLTNTNKVNSIATAASTTTGVKTINHIKNRTPIASPMSSPSPIKPFLHNSSYTRSSTPLKLRSGGPLSRTTTTTSTNATATTNTSLFEKKLGNDLLQKSGVFTPTYIPSPKYYYRMDSPTKTRRI